MAGKGQKSKDELPPLLEPGLHHMTADELRVVVVDGFPKSDRRPMLWGHFTDILDLLVSANIPCEVWVDGSFLTEKINPDDIDFVVDIPSAVFDAITPAQEVVIQQLADRVFRCDKHLDTYVMPTAPMGHVLFPATRETHARWERDFGQAYVSKEPKGIAVVEVSP